jgi:hypothetical protein
MKAKIYSIRQLEGARKAPYEEGKRLTYIAYTCYRVFIA